jgi:hypothetical protein
MSTCNVCAVRSGPKKRFSHAPVKLDDASLPQNQLSRQGYRCPLGTAALGSCASDALALRGISAYVTTDTISRPMQAFHHDRYAQDRRSARAWP